MKTVREIISVMTEQEQKEFIENLKNYNLEEETNNNLNNLIYTAFDWVYTKQGHKYWSNLAKKYS